MFRVITALARINRFSNAHPVEKIFLTLLPVVLLGFSHSILPPAVSIAVFMLLHYIYKNPFVIVLKFVFGITAFAAISSITFVFDYGIYYCAAVILRTAAAAASVAFLILTTPMDDVLYIFSKYSFLRDICDIAKSMERFLILIEDEYIVLKKTLISRGGFNSAAQTIKSAGKLGGLLFINTFIRWEEIRNGINSRCYKGSMHYCRGNFKFSMKRFFAIISFNICLIIIVFKFGRG